MNQDDLCFTSATDLAQHIAARDISPVEVMQAILQRIDALDGALNAFITVDPEEALAAARTAERAVMEGDELGPLHGVPFTVKDLLNTANMRTTFGSFAFEHNIPERDCVAVARLRQAGALLLGKTTTPEFGHKPFTEAPLFGRTVNPWDMNHTCGGSSGGAAAAVAAGMGPLAVGTDGGGSIRIPAACCGVVGMKQTLGVVPHDQTPDVFGLLAYIGPLTRSVADAGAMLAVMAGPDASDPHSLGRHVEGLKEAAMAGQDGLKGLKVAWRRFLGNDVIDSETEALFLDALRAFSEGGADLRELSDDFPASYASWAPLTFSIWANRFAEHAANLGDRMSATLRHWMAAGGQVSGVEIQQAMDLRTRLYRQVEHWFDDVDLVVTPTLARPALAADHNAFDDIEIEGRKVGGARQAWYPYTHPFNLTGHPAITLPCGWTKDGLPVGLQIIGPWLSDARVLAAAAAFEARRPWRDRRPEF